MTPAVLDLCCGLGGWARGFLDAGWIVVGVDVEPLPYPGHFVLGDLREFDPEPWRGVSLVVASPPCEEFSRHSMPWTRAKNPPPPDLSLVEACHRIARTLGVPLVLENVKGAVPWLGHPAARFGSRYLWGDGVPAILPYAPPSHKERLSSTQRRERAVIPYTLSRWVAECYRPRETQ